MKRNSLGALVAALIAVAGPSYSPAPSTLPPAGFRAGPSYPWPRRGNGSAKVRRAAAKRRRR